jgi:hypothetical protein
VLGGFAVFWPGGISDAFLLALSMTWNVALAMPLPAQGKCTRAQWVRIHGCVGGFQTRALLIPSFAGFNPARFRRILLTS